MGILTKGDSKLYRTWFKEMCKLRGFTVRYQSYKSLSSSIYGELNPENLNDAINIDVIYEENPKRTTLRNIGWISEKSDDKPYIMLLPFDTPDISVESRIMIPQDVENLELSKYKLFKITSINTLIEYPECYTCTIVPVFESDNIKNNYNNNYNYIEDN